MTSSFFEDHSPEMNDRVASNLQLFRSIFIPYPKHVAIHARFDYLQKLGRSLRGTPQKGLRVLAPSGSGKTKVAKSYIRMVMAAEDHASDRVPVLYIQLEKAATARKLYIALLDKLGDPKPEKGTEQALKRRLLDYLQRLNVELLIIDEVQHLNYRVNAKNDVTDALKVFLDSGVVPIVFLGTEAASGMFRRNLQLGSRLLPPCDLVPLKSQDAEDRRVFAIFVERLSQEIVELGILPSKDPVTHVFTLGCLHQASGGVIGRVATIFETAMEIAVRRGAARIEPYDLALAVDRWAIPQGFGDANPFHQRGQQ